MHYFRKDTKQLSAVCGVGSGDATGGEEVFSFRKIACAFNACFDIYVDKGHVRNLRIY